MKQTINLGAYGWLHEHWLNSFYPEDLPEDWRLSYYSNEFNTVLVPADYWQTIQVDDCEDWIDGVQPEFQFFIECHGSMFENVSLEGLTEALQILKPQLSSLVFLDEQQIDDTAKKKFGRLIEALELDVFGAAPDPMAQKIWRPESAQCKPFYSSFAYIEDELSDLRAARVLVEKFALHLKEDEKTAGQATMIVDHPRLQAGNISKFRSVLEVMGY